MTSIKSLSPRRSGNSVGLEIRYERTFLLDLQQLEPVARQQIQQFVFEDFYQINQLYALPGFHQLRASGIFYCFTLDRYLLSLEMTGQIVKFLRILPEPEI